MGTQDDINKELRLRIKNLEEANNINNRLLKINNKKLKLLGTLSLEETKKTETLKNILNEPENQLWSELL